MKLKLKTKFSLFFSAMFMLTIVGYWLFVDIIITIYRVLPSYLKKRVLGIKMEWILFALFTVGIFGGGVSLVVNTEMRKFESHVAAGHQINIDDNKYRCTKLRDITVEQFLKEREDAKEKRKKQRGDQL